MKTLIKFDEKYIAIGAIQFISKKTVWSKIYEQNIFLIIINDKAMYEVNSNMPEIVWDYLNEEYRDKQFKKLINVLETFEHIEILE